MGKSRLSLIAALLVACSVASTSATGLPSQITSLTIPSSADTLEVNFCGGVVIITADSSLPAQVTLNATAGLLSTTSVMQSTVGSTYKITTGYFSGTYQIQATINIPSSSFSSLVVGNADVYLTGALFPSASMSSIVAQGSGNVYVSSGHIPNSYTVGSSLSLTASASGNICIDTVNVDAVTASVSGSGDIKIAGTIRASTSVVLIVSGSGDIYACGINAPSAVVTNQGSGDIYVRTSGDLHYTMFGSGNVYYAAAKSLIDDGTSSFSAPTFGSCPIAALSSCDIPPTSIPTMTIDYTASTCTTMGGSGGSQVLPTFFVASALALFAFIINF